MPSKKQAAGEDVSDAPPTDIDPYATLELDPSATPDDIKKAYRKQALRHHPDKAPPESADEAKTVFQHIAFAYAVLSDPRRRARFDATGSTSESLLDVGEDGEPFDWTEFYRNAFAESVTDDKIATFAETYRESDEEKRDILAAFEKSAGNMDGVYERVMLSNVLWDDARFRALIDAAIKSGEAVAHDAYVHEPEETKTKRIKKAESEKKQAEKEARKTAKKNRTKTPTSKGSKSRNDGEDELLTLIQSRQASRAAEGFLANLEQKYGPKNGGRKKRSEPIDEPPEEAFAAVGERAKKARTKK